MKRPFLVALIGVLCLPARVPADELASKRLAVIGNGRVEVRPDVMDVSATVSGTGEIASDALKNFRANRRRAVEAVTKLKIPGLEIKGTGVSVISNAIVQQFQQRFGNMQQGPSDHTTFRETLTFTVSGIDHLSDEQVQDLVSKVLDAAKDAGLTLGHPTDQNSYFYNADSYKPQIDFFRLSDAEAVRQKALDLAAKDAREKAEQMARRLKLTIGKVAEVRDASSRQMANRQVVVVGRNDSTSTESSPSLHSISVDAFVQVEYQITN
ncbi:MAG TPA: SIMPL domain-containing protein [Planctomycetaceae bacterium]|jgi:uncharacterized protein YggE|nr:SIMPL domain-containing protein [Planctomycetaceae bacterium]